MLIERFSARAVLVAVVMVTGSALGPGQAFAGTASATIAVTATVLSYCTIAAAPLAFGNYASVQVQATTTVTIACTATTPYNVGLNLGTGAGATVALREMTNGTATLGYQLFSNAAYTTQWGPTIGTNTVAGTATGASTPLTVYGQIPANELSTPGAYTDTVTATISY